MANVEFCEHDWPGSGCEECRAIYEARREKKRKELDATATSPVSNVEGEPVVPITKGMPELRISLIARAVRQSLRNYGHKVAESTLPECIAGDVERTLVAHETIWTKPRDCGINGGDLSESRDNIGSAYTRSTTPPQSRERGTI